MAKVKKTIDDIFYLSSDSNHSMKAIILIPSFFLLSKYSVPYY